MGAIRGTTLHDMIAAQTRGAPSKIAVTGPDGDLTYGDLEHRAERVAVRLTRLGVGIIANTTAEFAAFIESESDKWRKVVEKSGARVE